MRILPRRWRVPGLPLLAAAVLAACTSAPAPESRPGAAASGGLSLIPASFRDLPGWEADRHHEALPAFARSCEAFSRHDNPRRWLGEFTITGSVGDWQGLCRALFQQFPDGQGSASAVRRFLEEHLDPYLVQGENGGETGTFTGYYEAELRGCRTRTSTCRVPIHGMPRGSGPLPDRAAIETGALDGKAPVLYWAEDPVDVHILHIQGSGRLTLPDGSTVRIGYAGNNGHTFKGLGKIMQDKGLLAPGQTTMPHIRTWLKNNPTRATAIMRENPRYIFFRKIEGDGPIGAFGVPLTPRRSLAVDTRYVPLGLPLWLDSVDPDGEPLRRLMLAQDVGSAIKGVVRGDFFWGPGEPALEKAGRMKSPGRWYLLLPKSRRPATS